MIPIDKKTVFILAFLLVLAGFLGYRLGGGKDIPDNRNGADAVRENIEQAAGHNRAAVGHATNLETQRERSEGAVGRSLDRLEDNEERIGELADGINKLGDLVRESQSVLRGIRERNEKPPPGG